MTFTAQPTAVEAILGERVYPVDTAVALASIKKQEYGYAFLGRMSVLDVGVGRHYFSRYCSLILTSSTGGIFKFNIDAANEGTSHHILTLTKDVSPYSFLLRLPHILNDPSQVVYADGIAMYGDDRVPSEFFKVLAVYDNNGMLLVQNSTKDQSSPITTHTPTPQHDIL